MLIGHFKGTADTKPVGPLTRWKRWSSNAATGKFNCSANIKDIDVLAKVEVAPG
jgi:hypothetical protein